MAKQRFVLTLAGDYLRLEAAPKGVTSVAGMLARLRGGPVEADAEAVHSAPAAVVRALPSPQALDAVLEQAWDALHSADGPAPRNGVLEARLGLAHARLGLLRLAQERRGGPASSVAAQEPLVHAWMRHAWGLDPAAQVVRWRTCAGGAPALLVSSVGRAMFDGLERFCAARGLRFVRCVPALLHAMDGFEAGQGPEGAHTFVWTEGTLAGPRSGSVQLLRYEGRRLAELWRGWLPVAVHDGGEEGGGSALDGAVRRFQAFCGAPPAEEVHRAHLVGPSLAAAA